MLHYFPVKNAFHSKCRITNCLPNVRDNDKSLAIKSTYQIDRSFSAKGQKINLHISFTRFQPKAAHAGRHRDNSHTKTILFISCIFSPLARKFLFRCWNVCTEVAGDSKHSAMRFVKHWSLVNLRHFLPARLEATYFVFCVC